MTVLGLPHLTAKSSVIHRSPQPKKHDLDQYSELVYPVNVKT